MEGKTEKKTKNYQNGKIYCIRNYKNDEIYVGSTCQSLSQRMSQHRADMKTKRCQRTKIYETMADIGFEHFYIELLEDYPCENKNQLLRREGEYIRDLKASLNSLIAGRTQKEYNQENKERIAKRDRQYYLLNCESIKATKKLYNANNTEQIKQNKREYYVKNQEEILLKAKQYRIDNKDKITKADKERYERNKEKILANKREYYKRKKEEKLQNNMD